MLHNSVAFINIQIVTLHVAGRKCEIIAHVLICSYYSFHTYYLLPPKQKLSVVTIFKRNVKVQRTCSRPVILLSLDAIEKALNSSQSVFQASLPIFIFRGNQIENCILKLLCNSNNWAKCSCRCNLF